MVAAASLAAFAPLALATVAVGGTAIPLPDLLAALAAGPGAEAGVIGTIVWQLRLPRVALAALVGSSLALAGAGFQGAFRNHLADPYLLGSASGAGLVAALAIAAGWAAPLLPPAAFAGAAAAVALAVAFAQRSGALPVVPLLLAGVVVGSVLSAGTSLVLLAAREQSASILTWLLGSFAFASWPRVAAVLPWWIAAFALLLALARPLDVLQLGERSAATLGIGVERLKFLVVIAATLATAAAVAAAGVIGFIGLLVPHAVRLTVGPRHALLVPLTALWGGAFMMLADLVARTWIAPVELPVGVVTALVGAPIFLVLLRQRERA